jgi:pyruvate-ferredoxin/flavodoxin oxidoreductase
MSKGLEQQKAVVTCGLWPLYRYNPALKAEGKNPFQLDSKEPSTPLEDFMYKEVRFKSLKAVSADRADALLAKAKAQVARVWKEYEYLAARPF